MIILPQFVDIVWNYRIKKYYVSKGYNFTNEGSTFKAYVLDLKYHSPINIQVQCDYCSKIFNKGYGTYNDSIKINPKISCNDNSCANKKRQESIFIKYGVHNALKLQKFKDKSKETNLEKYGVEHASQSKEFREKVISTNNERYGVDHYNQTEHSRDQYKATCLEKYGFENTFQVEEFKDKSRATMIEKFGYEYNSQVPEIIEQMKISKNITLYKQGNAPSSAQQNMIHKLIGGELNYPVDSLMLDIAYPSEMIYVEYQGSGHDLSVQMGNMTKEKFINKEIARYQVLKKKGWKMIEIISTSTYDYLPYDSKILEMIEESKCILNSSLNWVSYNIDEGIIRTKDYLNTYDFGELRKTKRDYYTKAERKLS